MANKGYYSLLQYCPDMSRLEAANVGVLLISPDHEFADILVASGHDRVRRFFRTENVDYESLDAAKVAIRNRVRLDRRRLLDTAELESFIATRGNDLILTPIRPVKVIEPEASLRELFDDLVGGRRRMHQERSVALPELERSLRSPLLQGRVQFDRRVTVPLVGRRIRAPYAFQNGQLNLIKPEHFSGRETAATNAAMRLAVEGDLLRKYGTQEGQKAALVVVAEFAHGVEALRERVLELFDEYHVRHFDVDEIGQLVSEIEQQAH
jgi:hypothetical protein